MAWVWGFDLLHLKSWQPDPSLPEAWLPSVVSRWTVCLKWFQSTGLGVGIQIFRGHDPSSVGAFGVPWDVWESSPKSHRGRVGGCFQAILLLSFLLASLQAAFNTWGQELHLGKLPLQFLVEASSFQYSWPSHALNEHAIPELPPQTTNTSLPCMA